MSTELSEARARAGQLGGEGKRRQSPSRLLSDAYRRVLLEEVPLDWAEYIAKRIVEGCSIADLIAIAMARKAMRGNVKAAVEIGDRTEGKPVTPLLTAKVNTDENVIVVSDLAKKVEKEFGKIDRETEKLLLEDGGEHPTAEAYFNSQSMREMLVGEKREGEIEDSE